MANYNKPFNKIVDHEIEQKIIELLLTTRLSTTAIGKLFGISRGPVQAIKAKYYVIRPYHPRNKYNYIICKICNEVFYPYAYGNKLNKNGNLITNKYCSKKCYSNWQSSKENKRQNHPMWKTDRTKIKHIWSTAEWKEWKNYIFKRDNYQCQLCQKTDKRLVPHHIMYREEFPELTFDKNNGITLCNSCHGKLHWTDELLDIKLTWRSKLQLIVKNNSNLGREASLLHVG